MLTLCFSKTHSQSIIQFINFEWIAKKTGMIFKGTDIENKLQKIRSKQKKEGQILCEVQEILRKDDLKDEKISKELSSKTTSDSNEFVFDLFQVISV